jgi:hypothetical protein
MSDISEAPSASVDAQARNERAKVRPASASKEIAPPIQVLIGWIAEASKKDVLSHARGLAEDQLASMESSWVAIAPYRGGYFYEIHEGGGGRAYLPGIIAQLDRDPDQILWMSAGTAINRVLTVGITENVPYAVILTESESALVRQSGQDPIARTGRMHRLVSSGQGVMVSGIILAVMALGALGLSFNHASGLAQQPPTLVPYLPATMPFRTIANMTSSLADDRWLVYVVFEDGTWRSEYATLPPLVLPEDDAGARRSVVELRTGNDAPTDDPAAAEGAVGAAEGAVGATDADAAPEEPASAGTGAQP